MITHNTPIDTKAMETPSHFINYFQVLAQGPTIRVAFAEAGPMQPPNYRTAIVLTVQDAKELGQLLTGENNEHQATKENLTPST